MELLAILAVNRTTNANVTTDGKERIVMVGSFIQQNKFLMLNLIYIFNFQELDRLFPYGIIYGDKKIPLNNGDDGYIQIRFPLPFKFGCQRYDSYFVSYYFYVVTHVLQCTYFAY